VRKRRRRRRGSTALQMFRELTFHRPMSRRKKQHDYPMMKITTTKTMMVKKFSV